MGLSNDSLWQWTAGEVNERHVEVLAPQGRPSFRKGDMALRPDPNNDKDWWLLDFCEGGAVCLSPDDLPNLITVLNEVTLYLIDHPPKDNI